MLTIRNLTKTYPNGIQALQDVSLDIGQGIFGLLGPNGAGKSSLMRTLATLQDADSGSVLLNKIDVLNEPDRARHYLGYLPQDFGVYPHVSAHELLNQIAVFKGFIQSQERLDAVAHYLNLVNLYDQRHQKLGTFSGGMRQRFGIAQALLGAPKLLIVDEPTAGLDPAERIRFQNLLAEISQDRVLVLSTHIVEDLAELCSQMAILQQGRIIRQGNPSALIDGLQDQVWMKVLIDEPDINPDWVVLTVRMIRGQRCIRVMSADRPGDDFIPTSADLSDVYFSALQQSSTPVAA